MFKFSFGELEKGQRWQIWFVDKLAGGVQPRSSLAYGVVAEQSFIFLALANGPNAAGNHRT
jgi:hypothetical protein